MFLIPTKRNCGSWLKLYGDGRFSREGVQVYKGSKAPGMNIRNGGEIAYARYA